MGSATTSLQCARTVQGIDRGAHVFVDESERGATYYMAAAAFAASDLDVARKQMRALLKPGMRRLHMANERAVLRKGILTALRGTGVQARLYVCQSKPALARPACLRAIVEDAVEAGAGRLVLEDLSSARADRQLIRQVLADAKALEDLRYEHLAGHEDPLLWTADALAWTAGAGKNWYQLMEPVVAHSQRVAA